jgi:phytoene/squalene synthetase
VESHKKREIRFYYFLSSLFDIVGDEIVDSDTMPNQREFARLWRAHLKSMSPANHSKTVRESLYDRVIQKWEFEKVRG